MTSTYGAFYDADAHETKQLQYRK